ncbi:uncharacterized protein I303_101898 [Kwoniella dejecticola CBS 10117]|uniref:Allantoinase n=1 Tax=Kwoniella dejecticola CBS 10117 TaxID=1296121 RepID=A0A1A6ACG8_9TREE|nr:allantoinase [Kwoniella dejecticola CBS 10117]OBR87754.1 allantoinase [Kwoniella dejecticola CBS 10117]
MTIPRRQVILAFQALLPGEDHPRAATIEIDLESGTIISVQDGIVPPPTQEGVEVIRVEDGKVVLPGLVDTHVHLNQPGRTEWEGFQTGSLAAISGGVTTLIDMPLNSIPPTTTVEGLRVKQEEARRVGVNSDLGFWGGIIPGNQGELVGMLKEGVRGFKCFLIESGVDEFPCVDEDDLLQACEALKGTNALILFHAELDASGSCCPGSGGSESESESKITPKVNGHSHNHKLDHNHAEPQTQPSISSAITSASASASSSASASASYSEFLESRPESFELTALHLILKFAKLYPDLRFHIVHLSAASAIPLIRNARSSPLAGGLGIRNLTVETCFHYLCLSSEEIASDFSTEYKCCPPIRDESNRQKLIRGLLDGDIDYVVSDHSPCVPELKKGDFLESWGGVSSLGLGLSLLYTQLGPSVIHTDRSKAKDKDKDEDKDKERISLGRLVDWLSASQAKQVNLANKGALKVGYKADWVIFDPKAEWTVTSDSLLFKNKMSPYIGKTLKGLVEKTFLGGKLVWDHTKGIDGVTFSQGELL